MSSVSNFTKIDICSKALLLIGENTITSFTEDTEAARIAANLYELTYENLLTLHPWRFASKKSTLPRLTATPTNQWDYAFQLPADFLIAQYVDQASDNFQIYGDKLYSNEKSIILDHIFKPDESFLPAYFTELLELKLASMFSVPITESATKGEYYASLADKQLQKAKFVDSQSTPSIAPGLLDGSALINNRY